MCEATGTYHEWMAHYLVDAECELIIVLPNKIKNFFQSLEVKTVPDVSFAQAIAEYGFKKIEVWKNQMRYIIICAI